MGIIIGRQHSGSRSNAYTLVHVVFLMQVERKYQLRNEEDNSPRYNPHGGYERHGWEERDMVAVRSPSVYGTQQGRRAECMDVRDVHYVRTGAYSGNELRQGEDHRGRRERGPVEAPGERREARRLLSAYDKVRPSDTRGTQMSIRAFRAVIVD